MKEFDVPVEELAEDIRINVVDIEDFNERVVGAYNDGTAEKGLEADDQVARSIIPAGNRRIPRFQLYRSRYSGIHHGKLRRLHGLRDGVSRTRQSSAKSPNPQRWKNSLSNIEDEELRDRRWRSNGASRTSTSTFLKRRIRAAAGSSASSSIRRSARAAPNASMPAAITMP